MIRKKCTYKKIKINKKITARLVQSSSIVLFMIIVGLCAFGLDKNDMIEPKVESSVAAAGAECDVEATLYNNSSYSGAGVKLTESGATVSGWDRDDSKFLNVDVSIEKGNKATFVVEVVLPKQLYVVGTDIDYVPSGFKKVTFKHNGSMKVNGDAQVYNYHQNSGTLRYVVERKKNASIELAQIKLELRYDDAFWDNMANSSIVEAGTNPIEVRIKKGETSTTYDKNIKISKITAGSVGGVEFDQGWTYNPQEYISNRTQIYRTDFDAVHEGVENHYYKEYKTEIYFPYWTDTSTGRKYYLEYVDKDYMSEKGEKYDLSYVATENKLVITSKNYYTTDLYFGSLDIYFKLPSSLLTKSGNYLTFSGGTIKITVTNSIGTTGMVLADEKIESVSYAIKDDIDERVYTEDEENEIYYYDKDTREGMINFGETYIRNSGLLDSCEKEIIHEIPTEILIYAMDIVAGKKDEFLRLEYSLKDENGNKVYFDNAGNIVRSGTAGAKDTWQVSLKNTWYGTGYNIGRIFSVQDLPEAHRDYYFSYVKYTVNSIVSSCNYGIEFYGYLSKNAAQNKDFQINAKVVSIGNTSKATISSKLTVKTSTQKKVAGMIQARTLDVKTIVAGGSFDLKGYVDIDEYYGGYPNTPKSNDLVIGILLPKEMSIAQNTVSLTLNDGSSVNVNKFYSKSINDGNVMWIIEVDPSLYIGEYGTDDLVEESNLQNTEIPNKGYLDFKVTIDVDKSMPNVNLHTQDMLYFAVKNASVQNYSFISSESDPYDLNGDGSKTDKLMIQDEDDDQLISIIPNGMIMNVEDSITMSGDGEISDNIAMIKDKNDVVTYSVKVNNIESGTLSKYEQYIAIPKKNSIKDDDLIEDSGVDGFDFTLAKQVYFTGTDIFNVYYTVEQGLNYTQMRGLSSSKWYTYAQLVESYRLDDVTGIKVLLKNTVYNDFDTTINVDMKPSARNNEIKPGEINTWKSIGNYVFKYSNGKVAGYICTNGCKAQTAVSVEEKPTDSARLLDDTPSTGDTLTSEIYKWILLAVMSLLSIMLMKYSNIINKKYN